MKSTKLTIKKSTITKLGNVTGFRSGSKREFETIFTTYFF
jgi:hypothetical protein